MKRLVAVVEGAGDRSAVPRLVHRVLEDAGAFGWFVDDKRTLEVGSLPAFRKHLGRTTELLRRQSVDGVLVLLDLEDECPKAESVGLANEIRACGLPFPVAVVFAHREYEAWFLASLETITPHVADLPDDAVVTGDPEGPRGCKERLTDMMPHGKTYKETTHQAEYTSRVDLEAAAERSRSFRRLVHALEELTSGDLRVTPESQ